jgi:PilZ domain-containing protein
MSKSNPERRSGKRLPLRLPVSIRQGQLKTSGLSRDLNTSGIFLYTQSRLSEGSEMEMVLILPPELTGGEKQWVCCRASVVRVEDGVDGGEFGVAAHIRSIEAMPEIPG